MKHPSDSSTLSSRFSFSRTTHVPPPKLYRPLVVRSALALNCKWVWEILVHIILFQMYFRAVIHIWVIWVFSLHIHNKLITSTLCMNDISAITHSIKGPSSILSLNMCYMFWPWMIMTALYSYYNYFSVKLKYCHEPRSLQLCFSLPVINCSHARSWSGITLSLYYPPETITLLLFWLSVYCLCIDLV